MAKQMICVKSGVYLFLRQIRKKRTFFCKSSESEDGLSHPRVTICHPSHLLVSRPLRFGRL